MRAPGFVCAVLLLVSGCARHKDFPIYGQVSPFALTSQSGAAFAGDSLRGHVWLANFIYTNCPGPCPMMSERMRRIQNMTPPAIRLISFSVDPARDTPQALAAYGQRFGAQPDRWTLLTGDREILNRIDRDDFKLGTLDAAFSHSTRFVLVDQRGRIRAYYSFGGEGTVEQIAHDAEELAKENS